MSQVQTVILRTLCGCEQQRAWTKPLPPEIRVPLKRPSLPFDPSRHDDDEAIEITVRRFVMRGHERGVPVYVEVGEAIADRPRAPMLTNEEWTSAIARWQRETVLRTHDADDKERAASWANADLEFLRRHDGGTIICHESTRSLIGAFYPAPSWDASAEAVRFWSEIRSLMDREP